MKICPNCGLQNPEESRFCNQCGAPIATGTPIAAGAPVAAGAPEESLNRNAAETPVPPQPVPVPPQSAPVQPYSAPVPPFAAPMQQGNIPPAAAAAPRRSPQNIVIIVIVAVLAAALLAAAVIFAVSRVNTPGTGGNDTFFSESQYTDSVDFSAVFSQYGSWSYGSVASDGSYMTIDTNPDNEEEHIDFAAYTALKNINAALGFSDALLEKMNQTRALDGRQSDENGKVKVSWSYHPDKGLEVLYEKK